MKETIGRLYNSQKIKDAFEFIKNDDANTLSQTLELVKIPAFSNEEKERSLHFQQLMENEGYEAIRDEVDNVYTKIKGTGSGPTVYITAHLDTVFPPDTPLTERREGERIFVPGISDDTRCLAEILSVMRAIKAADLKPAGDIIIGANVGEEGLGNLRGMRNFFKYNADSIDGFITVDGAGEGICIGAVGSIRYKVTFSGPGGHSNGAFGLVNPIHAMGRAISYISDIKTPQNPRTTFCVGVVEGGTSVNSIAGSCSMLMDLRSVSQQELLKLDSAFRECIKKAVTDENDRWEEERNSPFAHFDTSARIEVSIEEIGNRPAGMQTEDDTIVKIARQAYSAVGVTVPFLGAASTDANIPISLGIPALAISGGGKSGNAHNVDEWFDPTDAYLGVQRILLLLFALVGLDGVSDALLPVRKK